MWGHPFSDGDAFGSLSRPSQFSHASIRRLGMVCGVTNTLYGNQVAPTIMKEYGSTGGCMCGMSEPAPPRRRKRPGKKMFGGNCSGGTPMLRALGIMRGGGKGTRKCRPGAYKPTRKNLQRLSRHLAGKSIGFTQRSSLKAKGLLRRANGSCKVSKKYQ